MVAQKEAFSFSSLAFSPYFLYLLPLQKRRRWEIGSRPAAYVVIMAYNDDYMYIACMHLHTDTCTRMLRCAELAYSCCSTCRQPEKVHVNAESSSQPCCSQPW